MSAQSRHLPTRRPSAARAAITVALAVVAGFGLSACGDHLTIAPASEVRPAASAPAADGGVSVSGGATSISDGQDAWSVGADGSTSIRNGNGSLSVGADGSLTLSDGDRSLTVGSDGGTSVSAGSDG